jgi:hypothetical protein
MRIALDYDQTYTLDPDFWDLVIAAAKSRGHDILFLTMRRPDEPIYPHPDPELDIRVIYTSRRAKVQFAEANELQIDIFIDDCPFWLLNDSDGGRLPVPQRLQEIKQSV